MATRAVSDGAEKREEVLQQFDVAFSKYREVMTNLQEGSNLTLYGVNDIVFAKKRTKHRTKVLFGLGWSAPPIETRH